MPGEDYPTTGDYEDEYQRNREVCRNCKSAVDDAGCSFDEYYCTEKRKIVSEEDTCSSFERG